MVWRVVHVLGVVVVVGSDLAKYYVIRHVSGSEFTRRRLPVPVSFSVGGAVAASLAGALQYDVDNFQHGYQTGAEKQRQQATHLT